MMRKTDAKINSREWYVNTYSIPIGDVPDIHERLAGMPCGLDALDRQKGKQFTEQLMEMDRKTVWLNFMVTVAIRRKSRFDHSRTDEEESCIKLVAGPQELTHHQEDELHRLCLPKDEAVVLSISMEIDYRGTTVKEREQLDLPKREYEFILRGRPGSILFMRSLYLFCLSKQPRSHLSVDEFAGCLDFLTFVASWCALGSDARAKDKFREEKKEMKSLKRYVRDWKNSSLQERERILRKTVKTPNDAFEFWVDVSIWLLNDTTILFKSREDEVIETIYSFFYRVVKSYADDLLERNLISRCRYCGLYFRYRKGKKFCSLLKDGRNCRKRWWNEYDYARRKKGLL